MIKCEDAPRTIVCFNNNPVRIAMTIPNKYRGKTIVAPFLPEKAVAKAAKIASLAPQDIKGAIKMVINRSRGVSNVRAPNNSRHITTKTNNQRDKRFAR